MKLKYAMFEQKKNKLMTVLIFFQIVIVFIMLVSIISAITSRYEKYKPLECFFQGDVLDEEEEDDYDEDEDDEDYDGYETECPVCGKTVYFTDEDDPEDVVCPSCGEHFSCVCDGNCSDCGDPCPARDEEKE